MFGCYYLCNVLRDNNFISLIGVKKNFQMFWYSEVQVLFFSVVHYFTVTNILMKSWWQFISLDKFVFMHEMLSCIQKDCLLQVTRSAIYWLFNVFRLAIYSRHIIWNYLFNYLLFGRLCVWLSSGIRISKWEMPRFPCQACNLQALWNMVCEFFQGDYE